MAWDEDAVFVLRSLIGDNDVPLTYTDETLATFALVAAKRVVSGLRLGASYAVSLDNETITPDPTDGGVPGESFMNLVELLARLTILESEAKKAANQAIAIKDGPSSIDLKEVAKSKAALADDARKDFEQAKQDFLLRGGLDGDGVAVGHAVMGPIRTGAGWWPNGGSRMRS